MMHLEDRLTSSEGHFRVISGVILGSSGGSSGGHPRVIRGSSRGHPGVTLGVIGGQFWVTLGVIRGSILVHFGGHQGINFGSSGECSGGSVGVFSWGRKIKKSKHVWGRRGMFRGSKMSLNCPLFVPYLSLIGCNYMW